MVVALQSSPCPRLAFGRLLPPTSHDTISMLTIALIFGVPMPHRKYAWETLSDKQLLERRLSSLRVTVEGTWLEDCVSNLHEELEERGIRLRPHAWISSEWFSPDSTPGIGI